MQWTIEVERVPKEGLEYGPWWPFSVYVNGSQGFHSRTLKGALRQAMDYIASQEIK